MFDWFLIHDCESMAQYHSTLYSSQSPNVEPRYSPDGRSNTVNNLLGIQRPMHQASEQIDINTLWYYVHH